MVAAIEVGQLFEVVWASLLAGVGITLIFSLLVYSGARAGEARRDGNSTLSAVFVGLTGLSLLGFVGGVIFGVMILLDK